MIKFNYLILINLLLFLVNPCRSQSLIAVQNETSSTFFASLDSAITRAKSGDYIYLPGGSFTISVSINKQLQIIGVGHNPDSCASTGISQITGKILILNGSDHGSISGVKISGTVSFGVNANDVNINYFVVERCNITGNVVLSTRSANILINECIIQGIIIGNFIQGFQLTKCIVEGKEEYGGGSAACVLQSFSSNSYFINNIFIGYSTSLAQVNNCYFKNNIVTGYFLNNYGGSNILFQNNILYTPTPISDINNTLRNNITGPVSTLFKKQSGYVFDYKQDYHILDASPAHNAGTDGTDLGIYGTGSPWKEGSVPSNPHIQSKSISTVNGNLNVKIKVAAQDR